MAVHEMFDIDLWNKRIPFDTLPSYLKGGNTIAGPAHVVALENNRSTVGASRFDGVPVDVFAFGLGEGHHVHATKVGGCPSRPPGKPWPKLHGEPAQFLCQFRFDDSADHIATPADLLLVFANQDMRIDRILAEDFLCFEWNSHSECQVVAEGDWGAPPYSAAWYCQRYRTFDYRCTHELARRLEGVIPNFLQSEFERGIRLTCTIDAMKIGGLPVETERQPSVSNGGFLCALSEIVPYVAEYPWVNRRSRHSIGEVLSRDFSLRWCNGCTLNFYMPGSNHVEWEVVLH